MKALEKVDRWGPITVALITLLVVIALAWQYDSRLASQRATIEALQKQIDNANDYLSSRATLDVALRAELQTWQAYVVKLQLSLVQHGIEVPDPPGSVSPSHKKKEN